VKTVVTPILWRLRSKAKFLLDSDRLWSRFCLVQEGGSEATSASIIVRALKACPRASDHFEYKLGGTKSGGPNTKRRTLPHGPARSGSGTSRGS